MAKLDQKVVFISGASRGIGLGCALACLRHGARVAVAALQTAEAQPPLAVAGFFPSDRVLWLDCDVCDAAGFQQAVDRTATHFGRLDGMVNNAGWHPPGMSIEETSLTDFEDLMRLNLTSTFLGCKF